MTLPVEALWTIIGILLLGMISIIGWFLRKDYKRIEDGLEKETATRGQELKNERDARAADRHDLRLEIAAVGAARHAFELRVAEQYINADRLKEALGPLKASIDVMGEAQRELFDRLHAKQDKAG